ncbi:cytochrome P450 [Nonomuraea sp. bgisy101]|uniref:cytochrome P450 n=1 Tax=Nonomuraea sp. bgisy101 TaxID=3413784 RepID=UPI003D72F051
MSEPTTAAAMPTARVAGCPFDPPEDLARLREDQPIAPMVYPDGHLGWLATSHALVRAVLADPRFSHRADLTHAPLGGTRMGEPRPAPPGIFTAMDPPEHTRYRHLLTGQFTVRRMRRLTGRIQEITAEHLDAMERHGPPVDLVEAFALPIPGLVICELLGVPTGERARFQDDMSKLLSLEVSPEEKIAAFTTLTEFMHALVLAKRADPADDLLSDLVNGTDLTDEELTNISGILMGAGFETTANMLALGAFALMSHPGQLAALQADRGLTDRAVEELLRYLSIVPGTVRAALEDVELGGRLVRAGQSVTVSIPAANRDPEHFADPDTLDLHRSAAGHVAFGHGIHQCLGQQLARVEMQVGIPALFARFPTLRLAVPPEEVPLRTDMMIYGVHRLPVTWDVAQDEE